MIIKKPETREKTKRTFIRMDYIIDSSKGLSQGGCFKSATPLLSMLVKCKRHGDFDMEMFCLHCQKLACELCLKDGCCRENSHDILLVRDKELIDTLKKHFTEKILPKLESKKQLFCDEIDIIKKTAITHEAKCKSLKVMIDEKFEQLAQHLETTKTHFHNRANTISINNNQGKWSNDKTKCPNSKDDEDSSTYLRKRERALETISKEIDTMSNNMVESFEKTQLILSQYLESAHHSSSMVPHFSYNMIKKMQQLSSFIDTLEFVSTQSISISSPIMHENLSPTFLHHQICHSDDYPFTSIQNKVSKIQSECNQILSRAVFNNQTEYAELCVNEQQLNRNNFFLKRQNAKLRCQVDSLQRKVMDLSKVSLTLIKDKDCEIAKHKSNCTTLSSNFAHLKHSREHLLQSFLSSLSKTQNLIESKLDEKEKKLLNLQNKFQEIIHHKLLEKN